jgi:lysozyme
LGYLTLGVGRLIDKRKGGGITHDEAQYLLNNDIATRVEALQAKLPYFDSLSDVRKGVLLNMSFQLGIAGLLGFGRTLEMVKMGDYIGAADNMLKSKWAQQTPARANELANQMRTNTWQSG